MKCEVVGSSLAALIACEELLSHGMKVDHYVSREATIGGHFAGIKFEDFFCDIGMVLFEPRSESPPCEIGEYESQTGREINFFAHHVEEWIHNHSAELRPVPIQTSFNGQIFDDFLIADSLDLLKTLPSAKKSELRSGLSRAIRDSIPHPRDKGSDPFYCKPLQTVLREIYGAGIAEFLGEAAQKIAGPDSRFLVARAHRLLWLPLYYPETLLQALSTDSRPLEVLKFFAPSSGGISKIVRDLSTELDSKSQYVRIFRDRRDIANAAEDPDFFSDRGSDFQIIFTEGNGLSNLLTAFSSVHIGLVILKVERELEKRVVHSLTPGSSWFRASAGISKADVVTIELGSIAADETDDELELRALAATQELGIGPSKESKLLRTQIFFPINNGTMLRQKPHDWRKRTGSRFQYISYSDARSFNHQVLAGLRAKHDVEEAMS